MVAHFAEAGIKNTMYFELMITALKTSALLCIKNKVLSHALSHLHDTAKREGQSGIYEWVIITERLHSDSRLGFHIQKGLKSNYAFLLQWVLKINVILIIKNQLLYCLHIRNSKTKKRKMKMRKILKESTKQISHN